MILLLTSSHDLTTDTLIPYLGERAEVFRFNIDLWQQYSWSIWNGGYEITDPSGRICREKEVGAVYERKVIFNPPYIDTPAGGSPEAWLRNEVMLIWSSIKDLAFHYGKLALIHPSPYGTWYKMRQMRLAAEYFTVPDWQMLHSAKIRLSAPVVCKTNGVQPMGNGKILAVNKVDPNTVDVTYPWFLQQQVTDATHDVTVAYIAGKLFASEIKRVSTVDSRIAAVNGHAEWQPCELSNEEQQKIIAMMKATGLSFSRLDFMRTPNGLCFLEFNPNGQFAWLDIKNERGMITAICDEIMRVHNQHIS